MVSTVFHTDQASESMLRGPSRLMMASASVGESSVVPRLMPLYFWSQCRYSEVLVMRRSMDSPPLEPSRDPIVLMPMSRKSIS